MSATQPLTVLIPSRWPANLRRALTVLWHETAAHGVLGGVREVVTLPPTTAVVLENPAARPPRVAATRLPGARDRYAWERTDGALVIHAANPRSATSAICELARRRGARWLTAMRPLEVFPEFAEAIPARYQWEAAFPTTAVMLPASLGVGTTTELERQCRWLLFHHWNTYWSGSTDAAPAYGELVRACGLEYEVGGHDLNKAMPRRYFDERPDFFLVVRGRRRPEIGDFAWGNPEAAAVVRREAAKIFRRHRGADGLHVWYDDVHAGAEDEGAPASWSATRRAAEELRVVSGVHRRLAPGQRLITLAYNGQLLPDRTAHFDPHVKVLFCPRERCQVHTLSECGCNREYLALLQRWVDWLGPERLLYLDYSLDHFIRVSTWGAHPSGAVLANDTRRLARLGLGGFYTLYFSDYSDVETAAATYALMHAVARPFACDPARLQAEYFRIAFGPHAACARALHELYAPLQAAFLHYDEYRGVLKRDMRFPGLEQTRPSLHHARLLARALKTNGRQLDHALRAVPLPDVATPADREFYRLIHNLRFSRQNFAVAAAMLEGVPYLRGENRTAAGRRAWRRGRADLARLKPAIQAVNADPFAAGVWSRDWLACWSLPMERCLQFGQVDERD